MSRFELNYNDLKLKKYRKELRNNMTKAEFVLWNCIRKKQIKGIRFRRQFSVDKFIIDFYAPEIKLAIEVDGATHLTYEEHEYDKNRQKTLENLGITFLRFINPEIYESLDVVVEAIIKKVEELK